MHNHVHHTGGRQAAPVPKVQSLKSMSPKVAPRHEGRGSVSRYSLGIIVQCALQSVSDLMQRCFDFFISFLPHFDVTVGGAAASFCWKSPFSCFFYLREKQFKTLSLDIKRSPSCTEYFVFFRVFDFVWCTSFVWRREVGSEDHLPDYWRQVGKIATPAPLS